MWISYTDLPVDTSAQAVNAVVSRYNVWDNTKIRVWVCNVHVWHSCIQRALFYNKSAFTYSSNTCMRIRLWLLLVVVFYWCQAETHIYNNAVKIHKLNNKSPASHTYRVRRTWPARTDSPRQTYRKYPLSVGRRFPRPPPLTTCPPLRL